MSRPRNATENRLLAEEKAHASGISSLTVSSDGRKALTSSDDGSIRLWDVSGLKDSAAGGGAITSLASTSSVSSASAQGLASSTALHPSGAYFVSTGKGADVTVHSASSETFGAPLAVTPRLNAPTTSRIQPTGVKLRFSSAGDLLALGTDAGHVLLYQCPVPSPGTAASNDNTAAPTLRATSAAQSRPVTALAFDSLASTDASSAGHLFAGYDNGRIAMYDVSALSGSTASIDWNPITYLRGHKAPVSDLATVALPEGSNLAPTSGASSLLLASISPGDGALRLWDVGGAAKVCISTTKLDRKKHAPLPSNGKGESSSPGPPPPPPQLDEATDTLSTLSSSLSLLLQIGSQSLYRLSSSTHLQINPSIPPHVHMASSAAGLVEPQEMKGDIKELVEDFMDRAGSIKEGIAMLGVERTEEEHVSSGLVPVTNAAAQHDLTSVNLIPTLRRRSPSSNAWTKRCIRRTRSTQRRSKKQVSTEVVSRQSPGRDSRSCRPSLS